MYSKSHTRQGERSVNVTPDPPVTLAPGWVALTAASTPWAATRMELESRERRQDLRLLPKRRRSVPGGIEHGEGASASGQTRQCSDRANDFRFRRKRTWRSARLRHWAGNCDV